jgi:glycosyltransferase involved in cell wall biosynthesis
VPYTVPPKNFVKAYGSHRVRLIFIGADALASSWTAFDYKGGREVLEVFARLRQQFGQLELVVRASVPPDVKARYAGMDGLRVIEQRIVWEELEREYMSADICILPSQTTIPMTILEAMSYELPVVTIDSWANAEYVEDGKTGLVAPRSRRLPYYYGGTSQVNFGTVQYDKAMRVADHEVAEELANRVSMLVKDPELRRRLGKAGRWEVEKGRFSLPKTNERLGRVLDEAIAGDR